MKHFKFFYFLILTLLLCSNSYAQKTALLELEKTTKASVQKVYAATVRIWGYDTVRRTQNSSQFSGVLVSAEGHILTVAHAIKPNRTYMIMFPDGREVVGVGMGRMGLANMQNRPDLGMIKILEKGVWPFAEMGWSYSLKLNEPCFSISYPETLNQRLPTVRFGRVSKVMNQFGFVESTCKMEPGDSGGPLFDYMGRVVAMHSRCRESEDENLEVPIDLYRKYWEALNVAEDYNVLPTNMDDIETDPMVDKILSLQILANINSGFPELAERQKLTCITITSLENGIERKAVGTVFVGKGEYYLVGKSSMIYSKPGIAIEGKILKSRILKRDLENDLVLLHLEDKIVGGILIDKIERNELIKTQDIGTFLISPSPTGHKISIIGSGYFSQPRRFSAGYLGAPARFRNGKIELTTPVANSPAALAGLRTGDKITHINGVTMFKASNYGEELIKYDPGDTVVMQGIRDDNTFETNVVLAPRPVGAHVADKFKGGKSTRSDGFKTVFSHDPILRADECGGPVFDLKGNFYGINVARFSRTTTLVIPAHVVITFITSNLSI